MYQMSQQTTTVCRSARSIPPPESKSWSEKPQPRPLNLLRALPAYSLPSVASQGSPSILEHPREDQLPSSQLGKSAAMSCRSRICDSGAAFSNIYDLNGGPICLSFGCYPVGSSLTRPPRYLGLLTKPDSQKLEG